MSAPQVNTAPRGRKTVGKQPKAPQVNVYVAPQVNVPILGWKIAGTSAGATGGKLKPTPAVEAIAPQVYTQAPQVNTYMNTSKPFMRMIQQSRIVLS